MERQALLVSIRTLTEEILIHRRFAVSGVSRDPNKFGYKVFHTLKNAGYQVFAVNPNAEAIGEDPCFPTADNVPGPIDCLVTVTPPRITEETIREVSHLHIPYLWMQPGSESTAAFNLARSSGMQIVSGGPCIMSAVLELKGRRDTLV